MKIKCNKQKNEDSSSELLKLNKLKINKTLTVSAVEIPKSFYFLFKALYESLLESNKMLIHSSKKKMRNFFSIDETNPFLNYLIKEIEDEETFSYETLFKLGNCVYLFNFQESTIIAAFIYIDVLLEKKPSLLCFFSLEK